MLFDTKKSSFGKTIDPSFALKTLSTAIIKKKYLEFLHDHILV